MPSDMSYAQQLNAAHKARRSRMYAAAYVHPEIKTLPLPIAARPPAPIFTHSPIVRSIFTLQDQEYGDCKISRRDIANAVIQVQGISRADFLSHRRARKLTDSRQAYYYLCGKFTTSSFSEIGRSCRGRDHSTVLHGIRRVDDSLKDGDDTYSSLIEAVEKLLGVAEVKEVV
jgi:Bacterial dnaA protein helix-turn-helix